jgi:hypothetical protein
LLRSARASLLQHGGQGLLLAIDDAHHLDNLSATLVHQLALTGSARFVITVRAGEPAPDAITSLWKDRLLDRLDIEPFDAKQTKSLLEAVLGGPMETSSTDAVFTASQGNPLYLRHLAESAIGSGALRHVDGVWQLRGHIRLSAELSGLIGRHLEALPPRVTSVLEYLAVEEPLSLRDLTELAGREALEEAEDQRVIEVVKRGDDLVALRSSALCRAGAGVARPDRDAAVAHPAGRAAVVETNRAHQRQVEAHGVGDRERYAAAGGRCRHLVVGSDAAGRPVARGAPGAECP